MLRWRVILLDKLVKESLDYARTHLQALRIVWVDRAPQVVGAVEAVELCSDYSASGRIVAAVAQEKRFEDMLNRLLDDK